MLREASPILSLVGWEIFLNPSSAIWAPFFGGLLSVLPRRGIACRVTLFFPLRRRPSAVRRKLKYHASSFALPAMALVANRGQTPSHALMAAQRGRLGE